MFAVGTADASSTPAHKHIPSQKSKTAKAQHHKHRSTSDSARSERAVPRVPLASDQTNAPAPQLSPQLAATKQAIELVRQRKFSDATTLASSISDPVGQKLVEWTLLRNPGNAAGFDRYAVFIQANADWPSIPLLRQRAEARLWQERRDAATVRRFVGGQPVSALGRLALARVLLSEGDRASAAREVRAVWRSAEVSAELEANVADIFRNELSPADHIARMDRPGYRRFVLLGFIRRRLWGLRLARLFGAPSTNRSRRLLFQPFEISGNDGGRLRAGRVVLPEVALEPESPCRLGHALWRFMTARAVGRVKLGGGLSLLQAFLRPSRARETQRQRTDGEPDAMT
jgi:hypothetical protein